MGHQKYSYYIGRWQSPHSGHRWLIDHNLSQGKRVCICIRPMSIDENNPFTAEDVEDMLAIAFKKEVESAQVVLHILPVDVGEIVYGRGVGYEVNCLESQCPEHIKRISATEIRRQIRAGEDGWRDMVMDGVEPFLEAKFAPFEDCYDQSRTPRIRD